MIDYAQPLVELKNSAREYQLAMESKDYAMAADLARHMQRCTWLLVSAAEVVKP